MKSRFIKFFLTLVLVILIIVVYLNFNSLKILIFGVESDGFKESVGTIKLGNYLAFDGASDELIVIGKNYIKGYSNSAKEIFGESVTLIDAITDATGDYCIVAGTDSNKVYMINDNKKIWESDILGNVLNVSVNKNGYSAVIYKQAGYKTSIKVMNPAGDELFTSYLASTYAIDAKISNDNKKLAIAEINVDGIAAQSSIKIVDINKVTEQEIEKIALDNDALVTAIEFDDKNRLIILTDEKVFVYDDGLRDFVTLSSENINVATIENSNNFIMITKKENGIFDAEYELSIYEYKTDDITCKTYNLNDLPSIIVAKNKNIVMQIGNELYVVSTSGRLIKKCEIAGSVKSIVLFDDGNTAALIFRDKIELFKI